MDGGHGRGSERWQPGGTAHLATHLTAYLDTMAGSDYGSKVAATALAALALQPGQQVLEVGSGPGVLLPVLAEAVGPAGQVVAVDHSAAFLEQARARIEAAGLADVVTLHEADACQLPFPDDTFDAAHCERLLLHVDDPTAVLREMARVVRPGGTIVAAETNWLAAQLDHPDAETRDLILARKYASIRNPGIGLELYRRMYDVGLVDRQVVPIPLHSTDYDRVEPMAELRKSADSLVAEGRLDAARADAFFAYLREASARGSFLLQGTPILVAVGRVRASPPG